MKAQQTKKKNDGSAEISHPSSDLVGKANAGRCSLSAVIDSAISSGYDWSLEMDGTLRGSALHGSGLVRWSAVTPITGLRLEGNGDQTAESQMLNWACRPVAMDMVGWRFDEEQVLPTVPLQPRENPSEWETLPHTLAVSNDKANPGLPAMTLTDAATMKAGIAHLWMVIHTRTIPDRLPVAVTAYCIAQDPGGAIAQTKGLAFPEERYVDKEMEENLTSTATRIPVCIRGWGLNGF